jgi:uncharacterized phosphatase
MRRGRTRWNRDRWLQGRTDGPLDCCGRLQAFAAVELIEDQEPERAIASPLSRVSDTARIVAGALRLPVDLDPHLVGSATGRRGCGRS